MGKKGKEKIIDVEGYGLARGPYSILNRGPLFKIFLIVIFF